MSPRARRAAVLALGLLALGGATTLVVQALRSELVFFFSPSDIAADRAPRDRPFRVGGLVAEGSVQRNPHSLEVRFVVTDQARDTPVVFRGVLPDLFREGRGVVAQGRLREGWFHADQVLAKHDETYMPREVEKTLQPSAAAEAPR
jgi:cytochrome c-type biogenesis protein CcmE